MTDRERADRKRHVQFALASLGAASLLGSLFGACFGIVRTTAHCWCCDGIDT